MITTNPFYHGTIRKLIVAFGGLFNNLMIRTKDDTGATRKIVKVPIAFAQKEKFITRLQQDPSLQEDVEISLPRLSYEIVSYDYDSSRQLNKLNKKLCFRTDGTQIKTFAPVPYNITFNLYSYTKTLEDNLKIMEQILPFFGPDMNLRIKMIKDPEVVLDIPLILNSVTSDDQYDGSYEERRYIISTYSFTMRALIYGPLFGEEDVMDTGNHFPDEGPVQGVIKRVIVDVNGTSQFIAEIDPFVADSNDPHTVHESWTP